MQGSANNSASGQIPKEYTKFWPAFRNLLLEGGTLSVAGFLFTLPLLISLSFAGHISLYDLDVMALVLTGLMLFSAGISSGAIYTFQGSISGAIACEDIEQLRVTFRKGLASVCVVFWTIAVPCLLLSPFIFLALQQNYNVSYAAGFCLIGTIPCLFAIVLYQMFARLIIAHQKGYILVGTSALLVFSNSIFILWFVNFIKLGFPGIIISLNISYIFSLIVLVATSFYLVETMKQLHIFSLEEYAFNNLWPVIRQYLFATLIGLSDSIFFEVGTIIAGILGPVPLGAEAILSRYTFILLILSNEYLTVSISHISKAYAIRDRHLFFLELRVAVSLVILLAFGISLVNVLIRYPLAEMATKDSRVIELVVNLTPLVAFCTFLTIIWISCALIFFATDNIILPSIDSMQLN